MKKQIAFVLLCLIQSIFAMNQTKQTKSQLKQNKIRQEFLRQKEAQEDYNAIRGNQLFTKPFIPTLHSVQE